MSPTILITRPEASAVSFADQLRLRFGCDVKVILSPVLRIEFCGTLPDMANVKTLLFTSRNGVAAFLAKTARKDIPCICVGEATAGFARAHGLPATASTGSGDDLVKHVISNHESGPCLHVRGEHGVGEISLRLTKAGIPTAETILYQQVQHPLTDEACELLTGSNPVILPLFSPRTARLLFSEIKISAPVTVVAFSANVANEVPNALSNSVLVARQPDVAAMIRAIEPMIATGKLLETGNRAQ